MARRITKFEPSNRIIRAGWALIISGRLSRLDAFLEAAVRETWRATLGGLSIYGMAYFGHIGALDHHQAIYLARGTAPLPNMRTHLEPATEVTDRLRHESATDEETDIANIQAAIGQIRRRAEAWC